MSKFEWDEEKRLATLEKHKIDFRDVVEIFLTKPLILPARSEIEDRYIAVGLLHEKPVTLVFTIRGEKYRIITARRAREDEQARFEKLHSGRNTGA